MNARKSHLILGVLCFCAMACSKNASAPKTIVVDKDDRSPPSIHISAPEGVYSDDGKKTATPIDISRKISISGNPGVVNIVANDLESAIDFITIEIELEVECSTLKTDEKIADWTGKDKLTFTYDVSNDANPPPDLISSVHVPNKGIFFAVCKDSRPNNIPAGKSGEIKNSPTGRYMACACNRSGGDGDCATPKNKCSVLAGEITFSDMQGVVHYMLPKMTE